MSDFYSYSGGGLGVGGGGVAAATNYNAQQQQPQQYHQQSQQQQQQPQSMTIEEMRILHRNALSEAESKRTELRLVLASRYRELVGSSDEVLHMRERAEELNTLIGELPNLAEKVVAAATALENNEAVVRVGQGDAKEVEAGEEDEDKRSKISTDSLMAVRGELSRLPRDVHRCLDEKDVHGAASSLIALFDIIVACCAGR